MIIDGHSCVAKSGIPMRPIYQQNYPSFEGNDEAASHAATGWAGNRVSNHGRSAVVLDGDSLPTGQCESVRLAGQVHHGGGHVLMLQPCSLEAWITGGLLQQGHKRGCGAGCSVPRALRLHGNHSGQRLCVFSQRWRIP